jgi:pimeloyl-ACP methyl ester carboxylesterase
MPVHPDLLGAAERGEHKAIELITDWALGRRAHLGCNEAPGLWLTHAAMRLLERANPKALAGDFAACDAYKSAESAAPAVACPVLLLSGADDRMTPAAKAAAFARGFKDARCVTLPAAGHMMMLEQPTATLDALRQFL